MCYRRRVEAVIDSSSLISLARAGQLELLRSLPISVLVLDCVYVESVEDGRAHGHPDAAAIEHAVGATTRIAGAGSDATVHGATVDDLVVSAGARHGAVISNDQALGRRVKNLGGRWLRTADLVILAARSGQIEPMRAEGAIRALRATGRITDELCDAYIEELA